MYQEILMYSKNAVLIHCILFHCKLYLDILVEIILTLPIKCAVSRFSLMMRKHPIL